MRCRCGVVYWFKVPEGRLRRPGLVTTVMCTVKHCGADVPLYAHEAQRAA